MRIISGKFKGRKILRPLDSNTRPLKDMTKESIFNVIYHSKYFNLVLKNSSVLDIFSGSGSFGLECLSRGAKEAIFIEIYKPALEILRKNISSLKMDKKSQIIENDAFEKKNYKNLIKKFDIIFLDPPYREKKISELFKIIWELKLLKDSGIIIIHRNEKENEMHIKNFKIIDKRIYGISKVIFYELN